MEIYDVIVKLTGSIRPVGDSRIDEERFENLKVLTELVSKLIADIDSVQYDNKDFQQASIKRAVDFAGHFLSDDLGISNL